MEHCLNTTERKHMLKEITSDPFPQHNIIDGNSNTEMHHRKIMNTRAPRAFRAHCPAHAHVITIYTLYILWCSKERTNSKDLHTLSTTCTHFLTLHSQKHHIKLTCWMWQRTVECLEPIFNSCTQYRYPYIHAHTSGLALIKQFVWHCWTNAFPSVLLFSFKPTNTDTSRRMPFAYTVCNKSTHISYCLETDPV